MKLLLFTFALLPAFASAEDETPAANSWMPENQLEQERNRVILTNPKPIAIHALGDDDSRSLYLGGLEVKEAQDAYRQKLDAGTDPTTIPGPSAVYLSSLNNKYATPPKLAYELSGYQLGDPLSVPAPDSSTTVRHAFLYFTMSGNKITETCRKGGKNPENCTELKADRDIGLASYNSNSGWEWGGLAVKSGDAGGASAVSVIAHNGEIWLYYFGGKHESGNPGLFRQRLGADGVTHVAPPDAVKFEGALLASTFESADITRLRCDQNTFFALTMVAVTHDGTSMPFLTSMDGVTFKQSASSVMPFEGKVYAAPAQLPVNATNADCQNFNVKHETRRDLIYSERNTGGTWDVHTKEIKLQIP